MTSTNPFSGSLPGTDNKSFIDILAGGLVGGWATLQQSCRSIELMIGYDGTHIPLPWRQSNDDIVGFFKRRLLFYMTMTGQSQRRQDTTRRGRNPKHVSQFPGQLEPKSGAANGVRAIINLLLRKFKIHYSFGSTSHKLSRGTVGEVLEQVEGKGRPAYCQPTLASFSGRMPTAECRVPSLADSMP